MPVVGLIGQGQLAGLLIADTRSYARIYRTFLILADRFDVSLTVNAINIA